MESTKSRKVIINSYTIITGQLFGALISIINTFLVIRFLTVEEYAFLAIAYTLPNLFIPLGELGLNFAAIHFISVAVKAKNNYKAKMIFKINIFIKCVIGIAFASIVFILSSFTAQNIFQINDPNLIILIRISAIEIFSRILLQAIISALYGYEKVKFLRFIIIFNMSTNLTVTLLLIFLGQRLIGPMVGSIVASIIPIIICLSFIKFKIISEKDQVSTNSKKILRELFNYGSPLLLNSIIINFQMPFYIFLLTNLSSLFDVSYFNAAIKSAMIILIITQSISKILLPIFSKNRWSDKTERRLLINDYNLALKFISIIILPITCFLITFSNQIFPIIYGIKYTSASYFISTYFIIFLLIPFGSITIPTFLNSQKKTKYVFLIELCKFILSILFGIIFVLYFEGLGLIYGMIIGAILSLIIGNIVITKLFNNKLFISYKSNFFITLLALVNGFIVFILYLIISNFISPEMIILNIFILSFLFFLYFGLFFISIGLFNQITRQELDFLLNVFKEIKFLGTLFAIFVNLEKKILKIRQKA